MSKRPPAAIEADYNALAEAYLVGVIQLLHEQGHGELNFCRKPVETEDGGMYHLVLQHVSGPKIDIQKLPVENDSDFFGG
jgi:hypothetical protein